MRRGKRALEHVQIDGFVFDEARVVRQSEIDEYLYVFDQYPGKAGGAGIAAALHVLCKVCLKP